MFKRTCLALVTLLGLASTARADVVHRVEPGRPVDYPTCLVVPTYLHAMNLGATATHVFVTMPSDLGGFIDDFIVPPFGSVNRRYFRGPFFPGIRVQASGTPLQVTTSGCI